MSLPTPVLLAVTAVLLCAGLATQLTFSGRRGIGRRQAVLLPAALCYALATVVLVFSLFPDSVADGEAFGFTMGGAAGFTVVFLLLSYWWTNNTRPKDELEAALDIERKRADGLQHQLDAALAGRNSATVYSSRRYAFPLRSLRHRAIGIVTGDLAAVTEIDVWVNSENTMMEMARTQERTVSSTIRYYGAQCDDGGEIVDDTIHDELRAKMTGRRSVAAGTVISTGPGELAQTHGVRAVVHVAAVEGGPASGFRPVADIQACVRNVLLEVDRLAAAKVPARTVLFPLLGTGSATADLHRTARAMVTATANYFRGTGGSKIRTVYLLAYTDAHEDACLDAFRADSDVVTPHTSGG